jgi:hypothetical protein
MPRKKKQHYHKYTIRKKRSEPGYLVVRTNKGKDELWKRQSGMGTFTTKKEAQKEIVYHKKQDKKYGWKGY